jgi:hypothetical protein
LPRFSTEITVSDITKIADCGMREELRIADWMGWEIAECGLRISDCNWGLRNAREISDCGL